MVDRPDKRQKDIDRHIGQVAEFPLFAAAVVRATFQRQLTRLENHGYVTAEVTIVNRTDSALAHNTADWKLITPAGLTLLPHRGDLGGDKLLSDTKENGKTTEAQLTWEIGTEAKDIFLVYDRSDFDHGRGVWSVKL